MIRSARALAATLILGALVSQAAGAATATAAKPSAAPAKAPAAALGPQTYVLDRAHTYVGFQIRHIVSHVPGKFDAFTGSVTFDPKNLAAMQVSADIDANSIDTGNEKRDNHLRSADFFDVTNNPKITFKSTSVKAVDATHAEMTGDLTMRGVTKPVTLQVEFLGAMASQGGQSRAGFEAHGKVNRQDFGINWNRALDNGSFLLSDDVDLVIQVEAMYPAPPPPPAASQPVTPSGTSTSKGM